MIPAERAHLHVTASSHPGMSGKNNEDRYAVSAFQIDGNPPTPAVLAVVADGIGGHRAGEVAAEMAVEVISQVVAESEVTTDPVETLREAIRHASLAIYNQSVDQREQRGMGATCACGLIIGDRLYIATVGDSRIYLLRGEAIIQLSTDHTWVQEAIESGVLEPEKARSHPNAHVIRRYLGSRQTVTPDVRLRLHDQESDDQAEANQGLHLMPYDQLLLCSDGLTDLVNDDEILAVLQGRDREEALNELVELANQRGGHDNITIVIMQMPEGVLAPLPAQKADTRPPLGLACLGASALVLLAVVILGGLYVFLDRPSLFPGSTATTQGASITSPALLTLTAAPATSGPSPVASPTPSPATATLPGVDPSATPFVATLTPWPTNTRAP